MCMSCMGESPPAARPPSAQPEAAKRPAKAREAPPAAAATDDVQVSVPAEPVAPAARPKLAAVPAAEATAVMALAAGLVGETCWPAGGGAPEGGDPEATHVTVPGSGVGIVIGRGGATIKELQSRLVARISIGQPDHDSDTRGVDIKHDTSIATELAAAVEVLLLAGEKGGACECRALVRLGRGSGHDDEEIAAGLALVTAASSGSLHLPGHAGVPYLLSARLDACAVSGPLAGLRRASVLRLAAGSLAAMAAALASLRAALPAGACASVLAVTSCRPGRVGGLIGSRGSTVRSIREASGGHVLVDCIPAGAGADVAATLVWCDPARRSDVASLVSGAVADAAQLATASLPDDATQAARAAVRAGKTQAAADPAAASAATGGDTAVIMFRPDLSAAEAERRLRLVLAPVSLAAERVDVAVYGLTDDRVRDALLSAHRGGAAVRVLVDGEQARAPGADAAWLAERGVLVREAPGEADGRLFHHKVILADGRVLVTGSMNLTRHASTANWENMVVTSHPASVASFQAEFDRLWAAAGDGGDLMAPPPDTGAALVTAGPSAGSAGIVGAESVFFPCGPAGIERLCSYVGSASSSLRVAALTITSDRVREELKRRLDAGVDVRVLADASKAGASGSDLAWLSEQGVPVRVPPPGDDDSSLFHHKVRNAQRSDGTAGPPPCRAARDPAPPHAEHARTAAPPAPQFLVVDDAVTLTGSFNLTASAAERNFESIIAMAGPRIAADFATEFDELWGAAKAL